MHLNEEIIRELQKKPLTRNIIYLGTNQVAFAEHEKNFLWRIEEFLFFPPHAGTAKNGHVGSSRGGESGGYRDVMGFKSPFLLCKPPAMQWFSAHLHQKNCW